MLPLAFFDFRHSYFDDEEVDYAQWAVGWLRHLLAKDLPLPSLMRLWDVYLSSPEGLGLHPYVCLAVLKKFKDELEDLEHSEILSFLHRLPNIDIDQVTMEAKNLATDVQSLGLL